MKKVLLITLAIVLMASQCFAISMSGLKSSGILGSNAHTHNKTVPIRIYTITVIPTSANGFAQIIETNSAKQDLAYTAGTVGTGFITGKETKVRADIQGATANNAISISYAGGINIEENTFIDCHNALIQFYYKE